MEATLSAYLRHNQFRLATREDDQQRHALVGGYCPLHTWQYAAMASPRSASPPDTRRWSLPWPTRWNPSASEAALPRTWLPA
jgi:hypothetical protein